jgi:putative NADH-flavin reductase
MTPSRSRASWVGWCLLSAQPGWSWRGALATAEAFDAVREAGPQLDWTYLSPAPEMGPGERTGRYVSGLDKPVGNSITFDDFAVALVDEIERPSHRRQRFTVASS